MRHCKKCNKEGHYPEIDPVRMAGGYHTELCLPCRNTFDEFMRPNLRDMAVLEGRMAAAVMSGKEERAAELAGEINLERARLYAISKEWVASK